MGITAKRYRRLHYSRMNSTRTDQPLVPPASGGSHLSPGRRAREANLALHHANESQRLQALGGTASQGRGSRLSGPAASHHVSSR